MIYLPFLLPPIMTGLALLVSSAQLGVGRGILTLIAGHIVFVLAVAYRLVLTRLQSLPPSLIEASFDLGASRLADLAPCAAAASRFGDRDRRRPVT